MCLISILRLEQTPPKICVDFGSQNVSLLIDGEEDNDNMWTLLQSSKGYIKAIWNIA